MQINEQIRDKRKNIGLTQEQVANYLGVSTPAVNKWERGNTYPDISLLPALARLLKIDLNTLFSFNEELTELEVKVFIKELVETAQNGNYDTAFEMAKDKIREYPHCDSLLYSAANTLEALLILTTMDSGHKKEYEQQIIGWYEKTANSQEDAIKNAAIYMLVGKYIKNLDYDKASQLIEQIPEQNIDKTSFQVDILMYQEKIDEAAVLLEGKFLQSLTNLQTYLFKLIDIELKANEQKKAQQIAEIAQGMVPLFGLWHYGAFVPHLQIALHKKDVKQSLKQIKDLFEAAQAPWNMSMSPLYYRIAQNSFENIGNQFVPAFISELENSKEYDFLRSNKEFQELLSDYHKMANI